MEKARARNQLVETIKSFKKVIKLVNDVKKDSKAFGSDFGSVSKMQISLYQKKQPNLSILKESSIIKNYNLLEKSIYSPTTNVYSIV